jgi:hypothetical protein
MEHLYRILFPSPNLLTFSKPINQSITVRIGKVLYEDNEVIIEVEKYFAFKYSHFYEDSNNILFHRFDKCVTTGG